MSRIHEALKKAEQEKADHAPIDVPSLVMQAPVEIPTKIQTSAPVPVPPAALPQISGVARFEELQQRVDGLRPPAQPPVAASSTARRGRPNARVRGRRRRNG